MNRLRLVSICLLATLAAPAAWTASSFVVRDIRVEGLQRISAGTVFNYLPVRVGDSFGEEDSAALIKALFKTGFFKDVRVGRERDTLLVSVEERPSIASVKIDGNKDISADDLNKALKNVGLAEGRMFDRQILDKVEQELRRQYYSRGKYGLKLDTEVKEMSRNRVAITLKITEGKVAKIKQINIVGNQSFEDAELLKVFELSTSNLLSFYTKNDQYSKQKLGADLERLRSYYMDRGYINFDIESTQVSITPNKKEIYITINVKEGDVFTVNAVKLTGKTIVPPEELVPLVQIGPSDIFSRKLATETSKAIQDRLGDDGYIFSNVNMVPDIDTEKRTVNITFFVDPGKQVYVRRINMQGNTKTRDEVLRREMRQMEAAWASTTKIQRSKTRLERLGYFQDVNVETPAVPGTADQIDVNYTVTEKASGSLNAGVGYSQVQGIIFNASVTQDNVFGSGKRVSFTFNNSAVNTIYNLGYSNPYATLDGISSGWNINYRSTNAFQANLANYTSDVFSTGVNWGFPLSEYSSFRLNLDYEYTKLKASTTSGYCVNNPSIVVYSRSECLVPSDFVIQSFGSAKQINDFIAANGDKFNTFSVGMGFVHDTLNRAVFANSGGSQTLSVLATMPFSDITYYKASVNAVQYFPIAKDLTLMLRGDIAYGGAYGSTEGGLPFFEHYFAGGPLSVRGFMANTLGPRDTPTLEATLSGQIPRPFGGSSKMIGTAELLFPVPFMADNKSIRLGAFFDAGNVFQNGYDFGQLRYSTGLSAKWLSPFGALTFSIAQPLNAKTENYGQTIYYNANGTPIIINGAPYNANGTPVADQLQRFQFSFGQGF
ncbi:MAG: outer membrane protein assembly factor BamA [Candidatus Methylumidiphilus sp.]